MVKGFLLATGRVTISPPAWVTAVAIRPPAVATGAFAPARVSASAISTAACSLPAGIEARHDLQYGHFGHALRS
jgi:hypothetical protein